MVSKALLAVVVTSNLLMVLSGLFEQWLIINARRIFSYTDTLTPVLVSMGVGKILGSLMFPLLAELIGRKFCLLAMSIPFAIHFIFSEIFIKSTNLLCLVVLAGGMSVGGTFAVLPIYSGEICETNSRGQFISVEFSSYMFGIYVIGGLLSLTHIGDTILIITGVILTLIFVIGFGLTASESPYYKITPGLQNAAKAALDRLRGLHINTEIELNEIQGKVETNREVIHENEKVMTCMNAPGWVKSAIMAFGLIVSDILIYFSNTYTFWTLALNISSQAWTIILGTLYFLGACICPFLVDRIGRKLLLIITYGGVAVFFILLMIITCIADYADVYVNPMLSAIPGMISAIFLFIGLAPIQLILIAELFSMRTRMIASAVFTSLLFGFRLLVGIILGFTPGYLIILVMIFLAITMAVVVKMFYIETNKKSLQQIQLILNKK